MKRTFAITATLLLALPFAAWAHDHHEGAAEAAPAAERTLRDDYMFVFSAGEEKIKALAGAFSEEQYAWRPAEGVRSVGEAFQHVTNAVYFLGGFLGVEGPADGPKSFEEADAYEKAHANKADVLASLDKAFAHAHHIIHTATPEQLGKEVDFFGNKVAGRTLLLILADHNAEHLGQLIAYARANGVTPPWSQAPPAAEEGESGGGQ